MPRIEQPGHLSDMQSKVMLIVKVSPTPQVAYEELSSQPSDEENNIIGAREWCLQQGYLEEVEGGYAVTAEGEQVMMDEYLIDESGEKTEKGNKILPDEEPEGEAAGAAPPPEGGEMGGEMDLGMGGEEEPPFPAENSLFRYVHDLSKVIKG